jgi:hypothetical protein
MLARSIFRRGPKPEREEWKKKTNRAKVLEQVRAGREIPEELSDLLFPPNQEMDISDEDFNKYM